MPSGLQNQFEGLGASLGGFDSPHIPAIFIHGRSETIDNKKELLRQIPKIDEVLRDQRLFVCLESTSRVLVTDSAREVIEELRKRVFES